MTSVTGVLLNRGKHECAASFRYLGTAFLQVAVCAVGETDVDHVCVVGRRG